MLKKYILLTFIAIQSLNLLANSFKKGDTVNVWSIDGLALHEKPELASQKSLTIPYGEKIIVADDEIATKKLSVNLNIAYDPSNAGKDESYKLKGHWVKIHYNSHEGYVFSGYLSKMPCFKKAKHGFESDEAYLKRNYGEPITTIKKEKARKATTTTTKYKNGIVQIESTCEGCVNDELYLTNLSYQEALLFAKVWLFEGDAAEDIKIKLLKNGKIKISYDACD